MSTQKLISTFSRINCLVPENIQILFLVEIGNSRWKFSETQFKQACYEAKLEFWQGKGIQRTITLFGVGGMYEYILELHILQ